MIHNWEHVRRGFLLVLPAQSLSQRMQILGFEKWSIRQTDKVEKPRVFPSKISEVRSQGRGLSIALQTRPSLDGSQGILGSFTRAGLSWSAQVPLSSISGWHTDDGKALSDSGHRRSPLSMAFLFKSFRKASYNIPVQNGRSQNELAVLSGNDCYFRRISISI